VVPSDTEDELVNEREDDLESKIDDDMEAVNPIANILNCA
jgi:hypothetical protein